MKYVFTVFFVSFFQFAIAQNPHTARLKQELLQAKDDTGRVLLMSDISASYRFSKFDSSLWYGQQGLQLARRIRYIKGEGRCLANIARILAEQGNTPVALKYNLEALQLNEESKDWYGKVQTLNSIGLLLNVLGDLSEARSYFFKTINIYDEKRVKDDYALIVAMNNIGVTFYKEKQMDSAKYYLNKCFEILKHSNFLHMPDHGNPSSFVIREMGRFADLLGHDKEAFQYYQKSIAESKTENDLRSMSLAYQYLADWFGKYNQPDSSIDCAVKSLQAAESLPLPYGIIKASTMLKEYYKLRGNKDSTLKYTTLEMAARDSLFNPNRIREIELLNFTEQQKLQQVQEDKERFNNKVQLYASLSGIVVLLLGSFLLYRNNRHKQKAYLLLEQKNHEINAQKREAQIEAALERVRSRTMAMQRSDELREVISVLLLNLQGLDIDMEKRSVDILTFEEGSKGFTQWFASPEHANAMGLKTPYFDNQIFFDLLNAREKGIDFYAKSYSPEVKNAAFNYLFAVHAEMGNLPEKEKDYLFKGEYYELSCALEKNSAVGIANFSERLLSSQEHEILKRFARVFEQSYIRFLDLQKAEAQAREAQIELALESVRSRSLAMHHTGELKEVIKVVLQKLQELGVVMEKRTAIITVFEEGSKDGFQFVASPQHALPVGFKIPYFDNAILKDMRDAREEKIDFYSKSYSVEEKNELFEHFFEFSDLKHLPEKEKSYLLGAEYYELSLALKMHSLVAIANFTNIPLTSQENNILKRFANVFEQVYLRFKDLQNAEAQAREAQIQLGLERVRARTMAMQRSEELAQTCELLFEEFQKLRILNMKEQGTIDRAVIGIINEANHSLDFWLNGLDGEQYSRNFSYSLDEPLTGTKVYSAWKEGVSSLVIDLQEEQLKQWVDYLKTIQVPIKPEYMRNRRVNTYAFFSKGVLGITTDEPVIKESVELLQRFAITFDLTYTRFTDLQNAEARTVIAVREASLDRVRAEIASMRHAEDLQRITPLVWRELMVLNVPFFRCGLFIVDEAARQIHFYLSTPDGKPLAALNLTFEAIGTIQEALAHWRMKKVYITQWTKEEFVSFAQSLIEQGQIDSQYSYQGGEEAPASITLHFIPFGQGMLYIGSAEALSVNHIESVQALSDAFETAYARYEDFIKLEAAKKQIENTLKDLRDTQSQLIQSEKMASLGELTAGIAHEIQNPLNFVNNFSEINTELISEMKVEIAKGNIDEVSAIADDIEENEQKINHHGKRADAIVKGMLQHSRSSSGQKEPTDINALADEYLRLSYHGLRAKNKSFNAKFETDFDLSIPKINVVPQDIGRVVLNLINNAFYAVSEKKTLRQAQGDSYEPTVSVSTRKLNGLVEMKVRDNGNGIPAKLMDKIFQPFFTTKPTGQGTGLGLSLSFDIVKAHGGELKVETKEGEGAAFIIQLPIV